MSFSKLPVPLWSNFFKINPVLALSERADPILRYFIKRDLMGECVEPIDIIWNSPEALKILKKQTES
jgi:hypothetical protein